MTNRTQPITISLYPSDVLKSVYWGYSWLLSLHRRLFSAARQTSHSALETNSNVALDNPSGRGTAGAGGLGGVSTLIIGRQSEGSLISPIMLKWRFNCACPVKTPITSLSVCRGILHRSLSLRRHLSLIISFDCCVLLCVTGNNLSTMEHRAIFR